MNSTDPILDELHAIREQLLAESGGTLAGLVARLQDEQNKSGRTIIKNARTKDCTEADDRPQSDGKFTPSAR
jgi:hypothetical protein